MPDVWRSERAEVCALYLENLNRAPMHRKEML
jgi:hypothetical protein